jgi:hypothetical protein
VSTAVGPIACQVAVAAVLAWGAAAMSGAPAVKLLWARTVSVRLRPGCQPRSARNFFAWITRGGRALTGGQAPCAKASAAAANARMANIAVGSACNTTPAQPARPEPIQRRPPRALVPLPGAGLLEIGRESPMNTRPESDSGLPSLHPPREIWSEPNGLRSAKHAISGFGIWLRL